MPGMKFVLASKNKHKQAELQTILAPYGIELVLQSELGLDLEVEENGATFLDNARLKAEAVMRASGLPAIADDSGLAVDALQGAPGVYSARYGGEACRNDSDRNALLLENLRQVPETERTARFICCICCRFPDGREVIGQGSCEGLITFAPAGEQGFGYDPIFYVPSEGCTFAQIPAERKNSLSHRGRAIQDFYAKLQKEITLC